MKMYIYGAGNVGKIAARMARNYGILGDIAGFIDCCQPREVDGVYVFRVDEVGQEDARVLIAISDESVAQDVFCELHKRGFSDVWWFSGNNIKFGKDFWEEQCISCENWADNMLWHVEMHIMDACNLNCRGCTHFSPLFKMEMPNLETRIRDAEMLKNKVSHIVRLMILGGEPFLNPEIGDYALRLRELLPYTAITIVTNGILIPRQKDRTLKKIKDSDVKISISEYEPVRKIKKEIGSRLDGFGIVYGFRPWEGKMSFNKPLSVNKRTKLRQMGISCGCVNIYNGKIARCPTLMFIDKFNERFGQMLPNGGIYDIEAVPTGRALVDLLKKPVPLCAHCVENSVDWGVCGKDVVLGDFAVRD